MKKVVYIFFVTKAIYTNKDNCDWKSAEKNLKVRISYDCMKDEIVWSRICMAQPYLQKMWNDDGSLRPAASYDIWECHTECMTLPDVIWRCHISIWRCKMSKWHCRMSKWRCKATFWRQPGYLDAQLSARMGSTQVESPICRARSQICKQFMLGLRFVCACHLAFDQRNPIENDHGIRPKKCCNGTIRSLAWLAFEKSFQWCHRTESKFSPMTQFTFFTDYFNFFSLNLSVLSPAPYLL